MLFNYKNREQNLYMHVEDMLSTNIKKISQLLRLK